MRRIDCLDLEFRITNAKEHHDSHNTKLSYLLFRFHYQKTISSSYLS